MLRNDEQRVLSKLEGWGMPYAIFRHPSLDTVETAKRLRGDIDAAHVKNLFLRDKKEQMWVVTVLEATQVDLKALRGVLGATGVLSFGSADRLGRVLGILPGAVSPLAVLTAEEPVGLVLDEGLRAYEHVGVHPLHNQATVRMLVADLGRLPVSMRWVRFGEGATKA